MKTVETETIDAILGGKRDRYGELVERHQKMVYGIAWSYLGDANLAEDAAQEAFIRAYRYLATLRDPSKFSGWLAGIARNISISLGRTRRRELSRVKRWEVEPAAAAVQSEAETTETESLDDQLRHAMAEVPGIHRETLTLFYIEGRSVRDVAMALDISEPAVKTRLHRARKALRIELERRLADSLEGLRPTSGLRGSVMAMLPAVPIGAGTGALTLLGKAASLFSKSFASLTMILWVVCIQILPFALLMSWFARAQSRNYSNAEEHRFRKSLVRARVLKVILMAAVVIVASGALTSRFGSKLLFQLLSVYLLWGLWQSLHFLRVNRSPFAKAQVFTLAVMLASFVAIGFFDFPFETFLAGMLLINCVLYFTGQHMPQRMDYNLFLRGATGGLQQVSDETPPVSRSLAAHDMRAFAKFLGQLWLAQDYNVQRDRLTLKLPAASATVRNMLIGTGISRGSHIILNADGTCHAQMGPNDLTAISRVAGQTVDIQDVPRTVERAVGHACALFMAGETKAARSMLCAYSDQEIFKNASDKTKTYRRAAVISIGGSLVALLCLVLARFLP